jgi:hypothetical protein
MKKFLALLTLAAPLVLAGEWTGYISDSKCGAAHNDGSDKSVACVKGCVKGGLKPVFVTGDKVIAIANPDKVPGDLLGKKVTVSGDLKDNALTIGEISAAN